MATKKRAALAESIVDAALAPRAANLSVWERAYDGKEAKSFLEHLTAQTVIWRTMTKLLSDMYREKHAAEFDFTDPAFQAKLLYSEGYKKALQDVNRLIPQTTENK